MPDRDKPPSPPVVVAVSQGEVTHAGEDRRNSPDQSRGSVNVNVAPPVDQAVLWGIPAKAQGWVRLGSIGFIMVMAAVYMYDSRAAARRAEEREVSRFNEVVELQRAREAQQERQHQSFLAEMRSFSVKVDAAMERAQSSATEVRTSRITMEQLAGRIDEALTRLYGELKRLVPAKKPAAGEKPDKDKVLDIEGPAGFPNPIPWLFDHAPPKQMPGEPEPAPRPRPCEVQGR